MGPRHPAEVILKSHFPETDPVASNEYKIKYSPGSGKNSDGKGVPKYAYNGEYASTAMDQDRYILAANASFSGGGCGNGTFGGTVDTHLFGDQSPAVVGTFLFR